MNRLFATGLLLFFITTVIMFFGKGDLSSSFYHTLLAANYLSHSDVTPANVNSNEYELEINILSNDLEMPWGMVFLPSGSLLITEKTGRLSSFNFALRTSTTIKGMPEVYYSGQTGLFDVVLHPDFNENHWVYISYAVRLDGLLKSIRLARAKLEGSRLQQFQVLFTAEPAQLTVKYFGGSLAFDHNNLLYMTIGDRDQPEQAQALDSHLGKVLRFTDNGAIPKTNPFIHTDNARPEIYSLGHRNPQGLTISPFTGELWLSEHGPKGGDEINIIQAGKNYGWPIISYGTDQEGVQVGIGTHKEGLAQPIHYYIPSIATAGIEFYTGKVFSAWKGNLFVGALQKTHLNRLVIDKQKVIKEERLLAQVGRRIRAVREGVDGFLYVLTEENLELENQTGMLLQIRPANADLLR